MCGGDITKSIPTQGKHEHVWTHNHQLSSKEQPAKPQVINDGFQAIWLILLGYFSSKIYWFLFLEKACILGLFFSFYKHRIYFKLQGILFCCSSSQKYVLGIFPSQSKTQICIEFCTGGRVSWVMNHHPLYNVPSIDEHLASFHCFD